MSARTRTARLAALAATGALVLGVPAAAQAGTTPTTIARRTATTVSPEVRMDQVKAAAHQAIVRRLATLADLAGRVQHAKYLTDGDRSALAAFVSGQQSGLTALDAKIQADTDRATLKTDVEAIVLDYRVYLLTVPKVHLVVAADTELRAAGRLDTLAAKLQARIDQAKSAGKDTTQAAADLAAMNQQVAAARTQAQGVPGQVLPLTPPNWEQSDKPVLTAARSSLATGRADLHAAVGLARKVVADLEALGS